MTEPNRSSSTRVVAAVAALVVLLAIGAWAVARSTGSGAEPESTVRPSASEEPQETGAAPTPTVGEAPTETAGPGPTPAPEESSGSPGAPEDGADPSLPPVALDEPAPFGTEVTARLLAVEAVQGQAEGPGEVAGPAVRVTVALENKTAGPVDLNTTVINAYAGEALQPLEPISGPGARPFAGELAAGRTAEGVYVFNTPADLRDHFEVTVSYDPVVPTVVLKGAAPPA